MTDGNMANLSPTIPINISRDPGKVENVYIGVDYSPDEIKEYTALFKEFHDILLGGWGKPGFLFFYLCTNKQTHSVGPFGNNLRTGCSLTQNSYGVPQNQVSVGKRGILLYL